MMYQSEDLGMVELRKVTMQLSTEHLLSVLKKHAEFRMEIVTSRGSYQRSILWEKYTHPEAFKKILLGIVDEFMAVIEEKETNQPTLPNPTGESIERDDSGTY